MFNKYLVNECWLAEQMDKEEVGWMINECMEGQINELMDR